MITSGEIEVKSKIEASADIKIEAFDTTKRYTKPHKHNKYFEVVYLNQGLGQHTIDGTEYPIEPPVCFFVRREEIHHWEINTPPAGFVIIFKDSFLEKAEDKQINNLILMLTKFQYFQIKDQTSIDSLFRLLVFELNQAEKFNQEVFESLLKTLLLKLVHLAPGRVKIVANGKPEQFLDLLVESPRNDVNYYAQKLNTSPQNLNLLCKKQFDMTASQLIGTHINREAKRLLMYTHKTVSEIAFDLHFSDDSHFVKYFKRLNKITPLNFRKSTI